MPGPAPTYEDLLQNPHDEDLFDYYATAQLAYLDSTTGKTTPLGKPGIYTMVRPSPDEKHLMVSRIHRPYSYQLTAQCVSAGRRGLGPHSETRIQDCRAWAVRAYADRWRAHRPPLLRLDSGEIGYADLGGSPGWRQPEGNRALPRQIVAHAAPFQGEPKEVFKTEQRFRGIQPLANGKALVEDYERSKRVLRTLEVDLDKRGYGAEADLQPERA